MMTSGKCFKKKAVPLTPEVGMSQPISFDGGVRLWGDAGVCGCHRDRLKKKLPSRGLTNRHKVII